MYAHLVTVKHIKQTVETTDSDLRDLISTIRDREKLKQVCNQLN